MASSSPSMPPLSTSSDPDPQLLRDLHQVGHEHTVRLVVFIGLYAAAAWGAFWLFGMLPSPWSWIACAPLYLLAAASLHGISLFTHDGVHGVLSLHKGWNRALSMVCAWPVLQNYSAYRVLHLKHHKFLGQEGDPDHYANYTSWTWLEFLMHWGRLILGYPAYLIAIPILGWRQGGKAERAWIALDVALLAALVTAVALFPLPRGLLVHGWVIPMILINTMVNIRGMSQHTLLSDYADPHRASRSILTNPVTAFFMCNENYHLEHHLYPGVPWYNLPKLHMALKPTLEAHEAPFIPSYFAFLRDFSTTSVRLLAARKTD